MQRGQDEVILYPRNVFPRLLGVEVVPFDSWIRMGRVWAPDVLGGPPPPSQLATSRINVASLRSSL